MLEARDDDGNPVGFPPYSFLVYMCEDRCLCLYNAFALQRNVSLSLEPVGTAT